MYTLYTSRCIIVTTQEFQEKQREISQAESQARTVISEPIPQRKFGRAGVTKEQQKQYLERRQSAIEALNQIQQQRYQLEQYNPDTQNRILDERRQIVLNKLAELRRSGTSDEQKYQLEQELSGIDEARRYVGQTSTQNLIGYSKDITASGINREEARQRQREKIKSILSLEIGNREASKIIESGTITSEQVQRLSPQTRQSLGVELQRQTEQTEFQRAVAAGAVASARGGGYLVPVEKNTLKEQQPSQERYSTDIQSTPREQQLQMSLPSQERYSGEYIKRAIKETKLQLKSHKDLLKSAGKGAVRSVISSSSDRDIGIAFVSARNKNIQKEIRGYEKRAGSKEDVKNFLITSSFLAAQTNILTGAATDIYLGYKAKEPAKTFYKTKSPESLVDLSFAVSPILFGRTIKSTRDYLKSPIILKRNYPTNAELKSQAILLNVRQGDKELDIAYFIVSGTKKERQEFIIPHYEKILEDINILKPVREQRLQDFTFKELQRLYPSGKTIIIEKQSAGVALTEPFIIKNGEIIASLRGTLSTGVATIKATNKRTSPITISKIEGGLRIRELEYDKIRVDSLSTSDKKILKNINRIYQDISIARRQVKGTTPITTISHLNVQRAYKKGTTISTGEVRIIDILKVGKKTGKSIPYGKRITRGDIVAIQEPKFLSKFDFEYGLKEFEVTKERIGFADVTFPKIKPPRNIGIIKGVTKRYEIELPELIQQVKTYGSKLNKPTKEIKQQRALQLKLSQVALQKQLAATALKLSRSLKTKTQSLKQLGLKQTQTRLSYPRIVGGEGTESQYTGMGKYEQMVASISISTLPASKINIKSYKINIKSYTSYPSASRELDIEILRTPQREILRTPYRRYPTSPKIKLPRLPKDIIRIYPLRLDKRTKLKGQDKNISRGINVLYRRRGKFKLIGMNLRPLQAAALATARADKTLARTIRFQGSREQLKQIKLDSSLFRRPRARSSLNVPYTFVERTKRAINTIGEKIGLKTAKRNLRYRGII